MLSDVSDVNDAVDRFYGVLLEGFRAHVPLKRFKPSNHPPWYSKRLIRLKNQKRNAHSRKDEDADSLMKYRALRSKFKNLQRTLYRKYLDVTEKNLISDPSQFRSYVNSKRKTSGYPSKMFRGTVKSDTAEGICNLFADFFENTYATDNPDDVDGIILRRNY